MAAMTVDDGFINNLPTGLAYELSVSKDLNPGNGITTFDANRIDDHVDGLLLTSPYKIIAADADADGHVTQADVDMR